MKYFVLLIWGALLFSSCSSGDDQALSILSDSYDFSQGLQGWDVNFVNYQVPKSNEDTLYHLSYEYTSLPSNLGNRKGIKISGTNVDGKLFMYMCKRIGGFQPNTDYTLAIEVELASAAQASLPEGTNVLIKAGTFFWEPKKVIEDNTYTLNVNTGAPDVSSGGLMLLGNIGTTTSGNVYSDKYSIIKLSSNDLTTLAPYQARTNANGEIWLMLAIDSSFLGTTTIYYTNVSYALSASN